MSPSGTGAALPRLAVNPERAGRVEPRAKKRRAKEYDLMSKPICDLHKVLFSKEVAA
jgi:hypothetical protein